MTPEASPQRGRRRRGLRNAVQQAVHGAILGGLAIGRIDIVGEQISIIPVDGAAARTDADDLQRRMDEAFDGDGH